jgi:Guanylate kinase
MKEGKFPLLVIDVQGAKTVKKIYKDAVSIFIAPPSLKVLHQRIAARNDGTKNIEVRLKTAKKELKQIKNYDYTVINDVLEQAVKDCRAIILAEKLKTARKTDFKNLK